MKKRLFLTGDQGCGKSTLIRNVLGGKLASAGGFLTVRTADGVELRAPNGVMEPVRFLELSGSEPVFHASLFLTGVKALLARQAAFAVLDEIGGIELLSPEFQQMLEAFFASGIPCIGVVKNPSSAEKLSRRLGLDDAYLQAAADLRRWLAQDPHTLLAHTDEDTKKLAAQWAREYAYE